MNIAIPQIKTLSRTIWNAYRHQYLKLDSVQSPLKSPLISATSPQGTILENRATICNHLRDSLEAQSHPAYCGLASTSVILKSFQHPVNQFIVLDPLKTNTPRDFFQSFGLPILDIRGIPSVWKYHLAKFLIYDGISIGGISHLLQLHGLQPRIMYFPQSNMEEFRSKIRLALKPNSKTRILCSINRKELGQRGSGHFSAVAGHDQETDRCLLLEVNQNRYPNAWVKTQVLWDSMSTYTQQGKPRGYILVESG